MKNETNQTPVAWTVEKNDARLIAAAPDLLAALKWAKDCFTPLLYPISPEEQDHARADAVHALIQISKAIAKVKEGDE